MDIGNNESIDLKPNDNFGRVKGSTIAVDYVWFKIMNKQLLCTRNEYISNLTTIKKYMKEDSAEWGSLKAESLNLHEALLIQEYHKFLSELTPPQISKVVSVATILSYNF